jgi:flagellar biosynthesis protein FliR
MMTMLPAFLHTWLYAMLRFLPLLLIPAFTPFTWAPLHVRIFLLIAIATLGATVMPSLPTEGLPLLSIVSELMVGACFGLAVMLPMAALGLPARLLDLQAGLASANLFNPSLQANDSLLGTILSLGGTFVFFALGFHLLIIKALIASARWIPLGGLAGAPRIDALLGLLGSQFLLGLMVVLPAVAGLFAVDLVVAYASRSMPQANIYFLALPVKIIAVLALLAGSLRLAPGLIGRLFADALAGSQSMLRA